MPDASARGPAGRFDKAYFDRYYLNPATAAATVRDAEIEADFVAAFLKHLDIEVRTIIDLGCGIGRLLKALAKRYPNAAPLGVDGSRHACETYGWKHGVLPDFAPNSSYDLVVCRDVLAYLDDADAAASIETLADAAGAALFFGALTIEDIALCDPERTDADVHLRPSAWYRRRLMEHFEPVGGGVWAEEAGRCVDLVAGPHLTWQPLLRNTWQRRVSGCSTATSCCYGKARRSAASASPCRRSPRSTGCSKPQGRLRPWASCRWRARSPGVLLGPLGGAIADRFSRRRLIVIGDALLGIAMLLVAFAFLVLDDAVAVKVGCLVASGVLTGLVNAFFRPAVMASVPNLVPLKKLNAANAYLSFSMMSSMTVGQAIGGILFRVLGAPVMFLVNGVTYLASSLSEAFIRMPQTLPKAPESLSSLLKTFGVDVAAGLRYVWRHAGLRNMVLAFAVLNFVSAPLAVLLPILLDVHHGLASDWYGYLMAAMAAGNLVGMTVAGAIGIDGRMRFVFGVATLFGVALSMLVLGVATNPSVLPGRQHGRRRLQRRDDGDLPDLDAGDYAGRTARSRVERDDDGDGRHDAAGDGTGRRRRGCGGSERAALVHRCGGGNERDRRRDGFQPELPPLLEHEARGGRALTGYGTNSRHTGDVDRSRSAIAM